MQETLNSSIKKRINCVKATIKNWYLLLQGNSIQWYNACQNGVKYKSVIGENFIGCKGWNRIQEQCSSLLEISSGHAEQAFIYFQPILPFPVTALFKQAAIMVQTVKKNHSSTEKYSIWNSNNYFLALSMLLEMRSKSISKKPSCNVWNTRSIFCPTATVLVSVILRCSKAFSWYIGEC